jgi:hypothetical protein
MLSRNNQGVEVFCSRTDAIVDIGIPMTQANVLQFGGNRIYASVKAAMG